MVRTVDFVFTIVILMIFLKKNEIRFFLIFRWFFCRLPIHRDQIFMNFSFFEDFFDIVFTIDELIFTCFLDEKVSTCWWNWKKHDKKKVFFFVSKPSYVKQSWILIWTVVSSMWETHQKWTKVFQKQKFVSPICKDGQICM